MKNIQPITALRNTAQLEQDLKEVDGPIFITKNGYSDLVILSPERYADLARASEQPPKAIRMPLNYLEEEQCDPLGFVRVESVSPKIKVGDVSFNLKEIEKAIDEAVGHGVAILVFPELCLTGYTCGDLFLTKTLLSQAEKGLLALERFSKGKPIFFVVGAPLRKDDSLYNCAVVFYNGKMLGCVPKSNVPNYKEFYELRHFAKAPLENGCISVGKKEIPFGNKLIFVDSAYKSLKISVEICEDAWVPDTPSTHAALAGADVILNLSASNELVAKADYRRSLVSMTSARLMSAYVYSDSSSYESTTDLVFSGHDLIAENGSVISESEPFGEGLAIADIDLEKLQSERLRNTFENERVSEYKFIFFSLKLKAPEKPLRHYSSKPFIPEGDRIDLDRVKAVLAIQANGLAQRLRSIGCKKVFIGLSGGLDSTLALLVSYEAFSILGYDTKGINAVTMPAFGTSERTHRNAIKLSDELGVSFREVNIKQSLLRHFKDIKHDPNDRNVTYENAQARERTQVLMDIANDEGGIMIGTGDLSELCLGWTTYSGDHMSSYGVNASIPKTLVRYLVEGFAIIHPEAATSLNDIVNTPISPELLPTDRKGAIAQKTEDKIGPYELHDFFIYHFLRFGYRPKKLFLIAKSAFAGKYDDAAIKKWMRVFFKRFFSNQFKRSCLPDGAKVGSVSISPRGDLRMPSDASSADYLKEVDEL
jgi:NAD+ synthase (glutamine-hydrolysing)